MGSAFYFPYEETAKIFAKYRVGFAYLFGSRAENYAKRNSDFDFAVYIDEPLKENRLKLRLGLFHELTHIFSPTPVDVVVINDIHSTILRYEIAKKGRLLYDKNPEARLRYELHVMQEYEEFAPFLATYNEKYIKAI